MQIAQGKEYVFKKSGNSARMIAPANPHIGLPCSTVERTGASVGKRMIVLKRALAVEPN